MLVVWNVHNVILFTTVKVIIIEMIRDESWFQWSILNYGYYFQKKKVFNELKYCLKIDIEISSKQRSLIIKMDYVFKDL